MSENEGPYASITFALHCVWVVDSLNCVEWSLLPPATEEMIAQTAGLRGRFQGDPSYEYESPERKEDSDRIYEDDSGVSAI